MNSHRTDLSIDSLQKAFSTAFNWVVERDRDSGIDDFAGAWVDLVASALQDVRFTATPAIDADSHPLKFLQTHRIATEVFVAARSGMRGARRSTSSCRSGSTQRRCFSATGFS